MRGLVRAVLVLAGILAASVCARAQEPAPVLPIPELGAEARAALETGLQRGASYGDPAFDALVDHVRSWGRLMHRWAASKALRPGVAPAREVTALAGSPEASGAPVVLFGQFLEREPLPKYANMERWLIAPLDPEDPSVAPDRAAIVFVDRTTSVVLGNPQPGWYVRIGARFYKPLTLPRRATGEDQAYPSFVGAVYGVSQRRSETSVSGLFVFVGIGVALMIAAFVVLLVVVSKVRAREPSLASRAGAGGVPGGAERWPEGDGAPPGDPSEALDRLSRGAETPERGSDG